MKTRLRERSTPEPETPDGVALHRETFEISQQRVLEWRANHSTRTPYHVLAATYRTYAPDIHKVIAVLQSGIQEKKADMAKYASDRAYVAECQEYITLYKKALAMIQETSQERWRKEQERERRLEEIEVEYRARLNQARASDLARRRSHTEVV